MLATVLLAATLAAPGPRLVMPEWTRVAVSPELVAFYSDHLAQALRNRHVEVMTSQEMVALLGLERQKELLGCSEASSSCVAELGNALGADAVLLVSLARLDDTLRVNLKVVSSKDATVRAETTGEAASQKKLLDVLEEAAGRLADSLREKGQPPGEVIRARPTVRSRAWIPAVFAGLLTAAGVVGVVAGNAQWKALNALPTPSSYQDARAIADAGGAWKSTAWVGFALGAGGFIATALMYFLGGEKSVEPTVWLSPTGSSVGLVGHLP